MKSVFIQPNTFHVSLEHLGTFMGHYSHHICLWTPEQYPTTIVTADPIAYHYFNDRNIPVMQMETSPMPHLLIEIKVYQLTSSETMHDGMGDTLFERRNG
ncbi:hypothetical protein CEXT_90511 [Caerostris extrusa]|uniref:Uncharacterized protein n=1 Tax=Caerostris extrusa TaxID=172846 RepID=A0AAV4MKV1_CAEEX|nr:hypothetical protein CEXT_90511 [Caerostris extrusa]